MRRWRGLLLAIICGVGVLGVAPPASAHEFSCRASALRIENHPLDDLIGDPFEPIVANPENRPCADDADAVIDETLEGPPGALTVRVLHASTSDDMGADARAGVAEVIVADATGVTVLRVGVLNAEATGRCEGGTPELSSDSEVVGATLGPQEIEIPPDDPATPADESHVDIPLGPLGTIHLNHEEFSTSEFGGFPVLTVTRRALWLEATPLGDVIVGEAIADVRGNPCNE